METAPAQQGQLLSFSDSATCIRRSSFGFSVSATCIHGQQFQLQLQRSTSALRQLQRRVHCGGFSCSVQLQRLAAFSFHLRGSLQLQRWRATCAHETAFLQLQRRVAGDFQQARRRLRRRGCRRARRMMATMTPERGTAAAAAGES